MEPKGLNVVVVIGDNQPQHGTAGHFRGQSVPSSWRDQGSKRLRYLTGHKLLGIVQIMAGGLCLAMSLVGFIVGSPMRYTFYGSGVYTGVVFVTAGLLGLLADAWNSRRLIVACLVTNIVGTCVAIGGGIFSLTELTINTDLVIYSAQVYQQAKCYIVTIVCIFELIVTIIHASLAGVTYGCCCTWQETVNPSDRVTSVPTVRHAPQASVTEVRVHHCPMVDPGDLPPPYSEIAGQ